MNHQELLSVLSYLGKLLLENGAETYRVEESIERMALAYGIKTVDVYAASTCIIITLMTADNESFSQVKRIHWRSTNLDKVDRLNRLCRQTCAQTPSLNIVQQSLAAIAHRPTYGLWMQVFGYALTTSSFALFFGGNVMDALCALLIGPCVKLASYKLEQYRTNPFFITIICSGIIAVLTIIGYSANFAHHKDMVIIGSVMTLVPGVALTNSIRDFIAGDFVAGQAKMTEAILTATCIALGTGIPIALLN